MMCMGSGRGLLSRVAINIVEMAIVILVTLAKKY